MGCSTDDVGNGRSTANFEYPEFCRGWEGLVKRVQCVQFEQVKWTKISDTIVCLQVVIRIELVTVVLSKQSLFHESVEIQVKKGCDTLGTLSQKNTEPFITLVVLNSEWYHESAQ